MLNFGNGQSLAGDPIRVNPRGLFVLVWALGIDGEAHAALGQRRVGIREQGSRRSGGATRVCEVHVLGGEDQVPLAARCLVIKRELRKLAAETAGEGRGPRHLIPAALETPAFEVDCGLVMTA